VLVLSAPVGEGHDAAAQALVAELRAEGLRAEAIDGLALLGPGLARFVLRGYGLQLRRAAWSWGLLYALSRSRVALRAIGFAARAYGGERLLAEIDRRGADRVVSTYPLISATLASLRRRGRLRVACAALITDFDPHPAWIHPALDANLSVAPGPQTTSVRPPIRDMPVARPSREEIRRQLAIPPHVRVAIIVGGAWGVGNLRGAALTIADLPGFHALVVTGRNARLMTALAAELPRESATVLGYVDGLAALLCAADVVVQNAGGVSCLEAFAAARPIVIFDPLPGHGKRNSRCMQATGVVTSARSRKALSRLLTSPGYWSSGAPATVAAGLALFASPAAAKVVAALAPRPAGVSTAQRGHSPLRPSLIPALLGIGTALLAVVTLGMHPLDPDVGPLLSML
jgi:UDP-N-acetylglucosamine:LPS N-acetylglucosamine transferase